MDKPGKYFKPNGKPINGNVEMFDGSGAEYSSSLLDYYAGQALAAIVSNSELYYLGAKRITELAFSYAELMIKERNKYMSQ